MLRQLSLLALALLTAPAHGQLAFHGNAARTGVFASPGPVEKPAVKWAFRAAGPIVTTPAVADGVVYIASLSGHLYAIAQGTGDKQWEFKSRLPIASSPAVADGTVYFVSSAGSLAAIDATTGQPRWTYATEYERRFEAKNLHGYPSAAQTIPDAWDVYTSSPAVVNGVVYFGSGDGSVYAIEARRGVLLWKFATGGVVHASPAVVDGTVYVGSWDGRLYALDAVTGERKWAFEAGQDPAIHNQVGFQSSPAVVGGTVYVGCRDGHVYALDAATGRKRWDYPTSKSWVNGTPAVRDGLVYVGTSDSSRFMALDARTGRLRFNFDAKSYVFTSAALAGRLVYFGTHAGFVYALDATTGALAWSFRTDGSKRDPMNVVNDDGSLDSAAFTPVFGDFQDMYVDFYRFVSAGAIFGSPTVDAGVLYVGSTDGTLYALG
jgi:outer membrane protein assembly factor BamB